MAKGLAFSDVRDYRPIGFTPVLSKAFDKIVAGKFSHFLEGNSLFPLSRFHIVVV